MNNYYFTFGTAHKLKSGYNMSDHWVKVTSLDYSSARDKFLEWSYENMQRRLGWAFQYDEKSFKPEFCRKGEYTHIVDKELII